MRYLSVCSGIEAASVAWHPLGWTPVAFSEIEKFPSAVLAHHYPDVPNLGDMTTMDVEPLGDIDILVGGTPCQAFSVAGLRQSLDDARGNLTLSYVRLIHELVEEHNLRNAVWENVPGVLSTKDNAFGCFLGAIVGSDEPLVPSPKPDDGKSSRHWRWDKKAGVHRLTWPRFGMVAGPRGRAAWAVKDAQYFGVAQRRRRVFVVSDFGNGADPAAVLFERESVPGNPAPRRESRKDVAPTISARPSGGGGLGTDFDLDGGVIQVAPTLRAGGNKTGGDRPPGTDVDTADSLVAIPFDTTQITSKANRSVPKAGDPMHPLAAGAHAPAIAIQAGALRENPESGPDGIGVQEGISYTLEARAEVQAVAWSIMPQNSGKDYKARQVDVAQPLMAGGPVGGNQGGDYIQQVWAVRRLTPRECERLQGFPEFLDRVRIEVWHSSDLRQNSAPAGTQNPRSPKSASNVGGSASARPANLAATVSSTSRPGPDLPVALNVLIDLERGEVQFRRAGRLIWSANTAEKPSASLLSMPLDAFVRLAAHMTQTAVPQTLHGRVELPQSINSSSPALLGSACVSASGQEIEELASDAAKFGTAVESCMKSITSPSGHNSQTCDLSLRTLSSCVTAAISSCIPSGTRQANSYAVTVDLIRSFTAIPYRNKPAADGPRYKALGNSMAVPVMRWIGERIDRFMPSAAAAPKPRFNFGRLVG